MRFLLGLLLSAGAVFAAMHYWEESQALSPASDQPELAELAIEEPGLEEPGIEEPGIEEPPIEEPAIKEPAIEIVARDDIAVDGSPDTDVREADEAVSDTVSQSSRDERAWTPFHSRYAATAFARLLSERIDHRFDVRRATGGFEVIFPYTTQDERAAILRQITEFTTGVADAGGAS